MDSSQLAELKMIEQDMIEEITSMIQDVEEGNMPSEFSHSMLCADHWYRLQDLATQIRQGNGDDVDEY